MVANWWMRSVFTKTRSFAPVSFNVASFHANRHELLPSTSLAHISVRTMAKGRDRPSSKDKHKADRPKVMLTDEEMEQVFAINDFRQAANKAIEDLKEELRLHHNLRLNPRVLEDIEIGYRGMRIRLGDLVTISRKGPNDLVINLSAVPEALKPAMSALAESGLAIAIQQDGNIIYIRLPKLTTEHRNKLVHAVNEAARTVKDNLKSRQLHKKFYHKTEGNKKHSSDLLFNVAANIDYYVRQRALEIDDIVSKKIESLSNSS